MNKKIFAIFVVYLLLSIPFSFADNHEKPKTNDDKDDKKDNAEREKQDKKETIEEYAQRIVKKPEELQLGSLTGEALKRAREAIRKALELKLLKVNDNKKHRDIVAQLLALEKSIPKEDKELAETVGEAYLGKPFSLEKGINKKTIRFVFKEGKFFVVDSTGTEHPLEEYGTWKKLAKVETNDEGELVLINEKGSRVVLKDSVTIKEGKLITKEGMEIFLDDTVKQEVDVTKQTLTCKSKTCSGLIDGVLKLSLTNKESIHIFFRSPNSNTRTYEVTGEVSGETSAGGSVVLDGKGTITTIRECFDNGCFTSIDSSRVFVKEGKVFLTDRRLGVLSGTNDPATVSVASIKGKSVGVCMFDGCNGFHPNSRGLDAWVQIRKTLGGSCTPSCENTWEAQIKGRVAFRDRNDALHISNHDNLVVTYKPINKDITGTAAGIFRIKSCEGCKAGEAVAYHALGNNEFYARYEPHSSNSKETQLRYKKIQGRFGSFANTMQHLIFNREGLQIPEQSLFKKGTMEPNQDQILRELGFQGKLFPITSVESKRNFYVVDENNFKYDDNGNEITVANLYASFVNGEILMDQRKVAKTVRSSFFLQDSEVDIVAKLDTLGLVGDARNKAFELFKGQRALELRADSKKAVMSYILDEIAENEVLNVRYSKQEIQKELRRLDAVEKGTKKIFDQQIIKGKSLADIYRSDSSPEVKEAFKDPLISHHFNLEQVKSSKKGTIEVLDPLTNTLVTRTIKPGESQEDFVNRIKRESALSSISSLLRKDDAEGALTLWGSYLNDRLDPNTQKDFLKSFSKMVAGEFDSPSGYKRDGDYLLDSGQSFRSVAAIGGIVNDPNKKYVLESDGIVRGISDPSILALYESGAITKEDLNRLIRLSSKHAENQKILGLGGVIEGAVFQSKETAILNFLTGGGLAAAKLVAMSIKAKNAAQGLVGVSNIAGSTALGFTHGLPVGFGGLNRVESLDGSQLAWSMQAKALGHRFDVDVEHLKGTNYAPPRGVVYDPKSPTKLTHNGLPWDTRKVVEWNGKAVDLNNPAQFNEKVTGLIRSTSDPSGLVDKLRKQGVVPNYVEFRATSSTGLVHRGHDWSPDNIRTIGDEQVDVTFWKSRDRSVSKAVDDFKSDFEYGGESVGAKTPAQYAQKADDFRKEIQSVDWSKVEMKSEPLRVARDPDFDKPVRTNDGNVIILPESQPEGVGVTPDGRKIWIYLDSARMSGSERFRTYRFEDEEGLTLVLKDSTKDEPGRITEFFNVPKKYREIDRDEIAAAKRADEEEDLWYDFINEGGDIDDLDGFDRFLWERRTTN